jgi:hypothetical protein
MFFGHKDIGKCRRSMEGVEKVKAKLHNGREPMRAIRSMEG